MKWLHSERLSEEYSRQHGYIWEITRDKTYNTIEVFHEADTAICIRQENKEVDMLIVSHAQAYDLLKALSRALETP